jgi:hypothetical protein
MSGRLWLRGLPVAVAVGGVLAACSLLVPLNEQQCTISSDCTARGGAFNGALCVNNVCVAPSHPEDAGVDAAAVDAGPWGCLDQPAQVLGSTPVAVTFTVLNALDPVVTAGSQGGTDFTALSYTPVPGVSVEGCNALDVFCTAPASSEAVSDDAGIATVVVPENFGGYFEFMNPGFLPSTLYPGRFLADASAFPATFGDLNTTATLSIASILRVPMLVDPEAGVGQAFVQVFDCFDRYAPGVSFTFGIVDAGPNEVQWYINDMFPSNGATQTDSQGTGGLLNVPAGSLLVTATLAGTTRVLGTANPLLRAGWVTYAWIRVRTHP